MEDAAVHEVGDFGLGVEAGFGGEFDTSRGDDFDLLTGRESLTPVKGERFMAVQSKRLSALPSQELQRQDSHPEQVRPMNALIALSHYHLDSLQVGTLSSPIA